MLFLVLDSYFLVVLVNSNCELQQELYTDLEYKCMVIK